MPITLYCVDGSPPVRSVYLCLKALGLKPDFKQVDLMQGEHLKPEYKKLNPQHTVPTLDDDGFITWDSHAINAYLASKYGKDDSLYPKDLQKRAIVDQRLYFDCGVLFPRISGIAAPIVFKNSKEISKEDHQKALDAFDILEKFLEGQNYVAGNHYTIADFSCIASVSTLVRVLRVPADGHPNIKSWIHRCEENLPGYEECQSKGLATFKALIDAKLN